MTFRRSLCRRGSVSRLLPGGISFFKLPRFLLTNSKFRKLSSDAKLLYSAMLNRLSLSAHNGWEWHGLHFVYFSLNAVMELLNCSKPKASKTLKELRDSRLIEGRIRLFPIKTTSTKKSSGGGGRKRS